MTTRQSIIAAVAASAALLAACASTPQAQRASGDAPQLLSRAGDPVNSFRLSGTVDSWTPVADHQLVIRTGANDAFLLSVDDTCLNLGFAQRIGVTTSMGNTVQRGFDYVRFDDHFQGQRCRITEIRPLMDADEVPVTGTE